MRTIRIATRQSPLALWQAEYVKNQLIQLHAGLECELVSMKTEGDRLSAKLSTVGGKGLFVKELEQALYDKTADIAVHSMKDVTVDLAEETLLPVILKRADPRDVFISKQYANMQTLPKGAMVGTSSLRRQCQLRAWRPDLVVRDLRGNVGTRLQKLDAGRYDAIILAAAGMLRLGLEKRISEVIPSEIMLPAIGQGAIGIQMRADDPTILKVIRPLNDVVAQRQVEAERALSRRLFGNCRLPLAALAAIEGAKMTLVALVGRTDGSEVVKDTVTGAAADWQAIGLQLAEKLLNRGADRILRELR